MVQEISPSSEASSVAHQPAQAPRWHRLYYLLAAFDLLTVMLTLALNHHVRESFATSVAVNQVWAQRLQAFSELAQLASEVNAPGNDVFDSHDVATERARMVANLGLFQENLRRLEEELQVTAMPAEVARLTPNFRAVSQAMTAMVDEANLIFSFFERNQPDQAGRRMATMDRRYAMLNQSMADLRHEVSMIQQEALASQQASAALLGRIEYLLAGLVVIMLGAATLYGHRLSREVAARAAERDQLLAERHTAERLAAEQTLLSRSEARWRSLIQHAADMILISSVDGRLRFSSPAAETIWGYASTALHQCVLSELVHPDDRPTLAPWWSNVATTTRLPHRLEVALRRANGSWRTAELTAINLADEPGIDGIVITVRDITERKDFEGQLTQQAFYDSLTLLPNRAFFHESLRQALAKAVRPEDISVLFIDLDNFKVINDSLGHHVGDSLLVAVARRLSECVRSQDTVARLGGDEFTILLEQPPESSTAIGLAERIAERLREPFKLGDREVFVSVSVGIAHGTISTAEGAEALLRDADLAMYQAKTHGKDRHVIFEAKMAREMLERLELESDLRQAVERNELILHYQPIVELTSGKVVEVEALVRWQHPRRGLLYPSSFILLAEQTGLILPIGQWVINEACRQIRAWHEEYPGAAPLTVSINLSARQFEHPNLVVDVAQTLARFGLAPSTVQLEITESMLLVDSATALTKLQQLRDLGVHLAIDDFGTGYSSLSYLRQLPFDTLKIDRAFINGLGQKSENTAIVRAILTLAQALSLAVTSEGIESSEQVDQLIELHCDRGQGFFFGKPLPPTSLVGLLSSYANNQPLDSQRHSSSSGPLAA